MINGYDIEPAGGELKTDLIAGLIQVAQPILMNLYGGDHTIAGIHLMRKVNPDLVIESFIICLRRGSISAGTHDLILVIGHPKCDIGQRAGSIRNDAPIDCISIQQAAIILRNDINGIVLDLIRSEEHTSEL